MNPPENDIDIIIEKALILFGTLRRSINKVEPRMKYIMMINSRPINPDYYYGNDRVIRIEEEIDDLFDDLFE